MIFVTFCYGFNTASGKHYCNSKKDKRFYGVFSKRFNTASGKHYCNRREEVKKAKAFAA